MDQLKTAFDYVWTHRFWFSLGLVAIFALAIYPSGSMAIQRETNAEINKLNAIWTKVQNYTSKNSPNKGWKDAASEKTSEISGAVDSVWEMVYRAQEKLFTWPNNVSEAFAGRPFGSDLASFDSNSSLVRYRRDSFEDQVWKIYWELNPIGYDAADNLVGIVEAPPGVISRAVWKRTPTSMDAWLAQEDLWIQRSIVRAIAKANTDPETDKQYGSWKDASVRRLMRIGIGQAGIGGRVAAAQSPTLQGFTPAQSQGPGQRGAGSRGGNGIVFERYLEKTDQYRVIPVYVSMLVDQMRIQRVLAALSNADFRYTVSQASFGVPDKEVEVPRLLLGSGQAVGSGVTGDPTFNTWQMNVWGTMRIYAMPPKLKDAYEAKRNEAGQKTEAVAKGATPKAVSPAPEPRATPKPAKEARPTPAPKAGASSGKSEP